jgi:hypothetical protein
LNPSQFLEEEDFEHTGRDYGLHSIIIMENCGLRLAILQFEKIGRGHGLRLEKFESSQPQYPLDLPIRFRFSPEARIAHWVSHGSPRFLNEEIREGSIAAQRH